MLPARFRAKSKTTQAGPTKVPPRFRARNFWRRAKIFGLRMRSWRDVRSSLPSLPFHKSDGSDRCLNVFGFQARKILQNFLSGVPSGEAGQHGAKRNASPLEYRFTAANLRVPDDADVHRFRHTIVKTIAWLRMKRGLISWFSLECPISVE